MKFGLGRFQIKDGISKGLYTRKLILKQNQGYSGYKFHYWFDRIYLEKFSYYILCGLYFSILAIPSVSYCIFCFFCFSKC